MTKLAAVCLVSGRGKNLQALIEAAAEPDFPVQIAAVCADKSNAQALTRAEKHNIPAKHLRFDSGFTDALIDILQQHDAKMLLLAGFMRVLQPPQLQAIAKLIPSGHILNIHPSLLPNFKGLHTHRRALEAGVPVHGCSIHLVTPELDSGLVIAQSRLTLRPHENEAQLAQRVLKLEVALYPQIVASLARYYQRHHRAKFSSSLSA